MRVGQLLVATIIITSALLGENAPIQPYTFTEVATQFDETRKAKIEYRLLYAVNSAGASVAQDLSPEAGGLRQILRDGVQILVDPVKRSVVSGPFFRPRLEAVACADRYMFREDTRFSIQPAAARVAGVTVDRMTVEFSQAQHRLDWWIAPSLGCVLFVGSRSETGG